MAVTNPQPTQPQPTDAERIAARGRPITLTDGREVRIRFGLRGLAQLERSFGSLKAVAEVLKAAVAAPGESAILDHLFTLIEAGLVHEKITADELDELLDPAQLHRYSAAMAAAFTEAMPKDATSGKVEVPGPPAPTPPGPLGPQAQADVTALVEASRAAPQPATAPSTGPASTGSEPSPLGEPTSSGGA